MSIIQTSLQCRLAAFRTPTWLAIACAVAIQFSMNAYAEFTLSQQNSETGAGSVGNALLAQPPDMPDMSNTLEPVTLTHDSEQNSEPASGNAPELSNMDWPELKTKLDALEEDQARKEALLSEWLDTHPNHLYYEEALFYLARVLSWQRQYNASLSAYDQLLAKSPHNSDYSLGKAQVYLWMKQPDKALPLLDTVIQASPNYEDAYRLKIQALQQQNEKAEAKQVRAEAMQRFPQSDWAEAKLPQDFPVELDAGYGYQHLTNGYSHWANQYLAFKKPFSRDAGIYGQIERTDRFDKADLGLSGGAYFPIPKSKWSVTAEGGISPTNNVLARWTGMGQIRRQLPFGFVAGARYRHTEYRDAVTEMGMYTLENYWRKFRTSYTLFQSYLHGSGQVFSHMGQLQYFYGDRNHVGLTGTLGQELINLGPIRGIQAADVQSLALSGLQMVKPRWGVTYLFILQRQGDLYTRRGFQLGLRYLI